MFEVATKSPIVFLNIHTSGLLIFLKALCTSTIWSTFACALVLIQQVFKTNAILFTITIGNFEIGYGHFVPLDVILCCSPNISSLDIHLSSGPTIWIGLITRFWLNLNYIRSYGLGHNIRVLSYLINCVSIENGRW